MSDTPRTDAVDKGISDVYGYPTTPHKMLTHAQALERDLARLMAENERLKKNAERYEWLKSKFSAVGAPPIYWNCEDFEPSENPLCGDTLDDAIDAALKVEPK